MATKFHSNNRLTQNIFDFVCVCVPGFKELVLDGKNRPFERKVKQHTNLKQVEHNMFGTTGGFGYINNVQVHYKLAIHEIKEVYKAGKLDPNTMKAKGYKSDRCESKAFVISTHENGEPRRATQTIYLFAQVRRRREHRVDFEQCAVRR